jgi:hypothetical protein
MDELLVFIGIIVFVAAMVWLIFGLGRVDRRRSEGSHPVDRRPDGGSAGLYAGHQ